MTKASHVSQACPDRWVMTCRAAAGPSHETPLSTGSAVGSLIQAMARRTTSKFRTTFWLTVSLAVVIAAAFLLPTGCSFEPSSLKRHAQKPVVIEHDEDGGE